MLLPLAPHECPVILSHISQTQTDVRIQAFAKALPQFGLADHGADPARQRLRKRFANLFAGWLGRCVRTTGQAAMYEDLLRGYASASLEQLDGTDPLGTSVGSCVLARIRVLGYLCGRPSCCVCRCYGVKRYSPSANLIFCTPAPAGRLHGEKDEHESGYVRRAFLEMVDILIDTARYATGLIVVDISLSPRFSLASRSAPPMGSPFSPQLLVSGATRASHFSLSAQARL